MIVCRISDIRRKSNWSRKQYSGAEHGLVRGIEVVNLLHSDGTDFYPIDYRIYAPEADAKTKEAKFERNLSDLLPYFIWYAIPELI
jgi:hypothetical protein